jgi:hypothetical protein
MSNSIVHHSRIAAPMTVQGQKRKGSQRANLVRFTPETGHWLARLACPKSANNRHMQRSKPYFLFDHLVGDRE